MDNDLVYEYVRQTAHAEPAHMEPVHGGLTASGKYRVSLGGRDWMVKLVPGDEKRDLWYGELNRRANDSFANPKMHRLFSDGILCLLSPWITGKSLELCLNACTEDETRAYAEQVAQILLRLHRNPLELPGAAQRLSDRLRNLCNAVEACGLTFPGHDECCALVRREANERGPRLLSFVHKDIRPENFIVSGGRLYLIDFDNGSLEDPAADFPYLTTMVLPEHRFYSRAVTETYLQEADYDTFWKDNLLYSTVRVMEYAVWKWQTQRRQVFIQADNLIRQYCGLSSLVPQWWKLK